MDSIQNLAFKIQNYSVAFVYEIVGELFFNQVFGLLEKNQCIHHYYTILPFQFSIFLNMNSIQNLAFKTQNLLF